MRHSRTMLALAILAVLAAAIPFVAARAPVKKGKVSRGKVLADVVDASVAESTMAPRMLSYIQPGGFSYPFGDYFEMDIDDRGDTHAVWGAGLNYQTPGSIWYTRGR